jgi:hypothetical protein
VRKLPKLLSTFISYHLAIIKKETETSNDPFSQNLSTTSKKEALLVVFFTFSSQRRTNQRPRNPDVSYTGVSAFDPAKASPSGL